MNELVRKDLLTSLGTWLALEIVCFGFLPAIGVGRSQINLEPWLILSLPLGIGGAFLLASGTQLITRLQRDDRWQRLATRVSGVLLSWIGLMGIGFPILITTALLFVAIFSRLRGE